MINDSFEERQPVQYLGESGFTQTCVLAISAIINSGILPEKATIVTNVCDMKSHPRQEEHLFIFWNWQYMPVVVVPSGFASGYSGEGPSGFALAICMVREKGIPIDGIYVTKSVFNAIDKGKIVYADDQIPKDIKAQSKSLSWPWYLWVREDIEIALERGHLWHHAYLQGYKSTDEILIAVSNIDLLNPDVGKKLRLAVDGIKNGVQTEDWQHAGQLIMDSWIELTQQLCDLEKIDTSDVTKDNVSGRLKKLPFDEKILSLAKACFDLNSKVRHDRRITQEVAVACVTSSIFTMQSIVLKYVKSPKPFK